MKKYDPTIHKNYKRVGIEFLPINECPVVGDYVVRPIVRQVFRGPRGDLVEEGSRRHSKN